jgi:hypothetical protein
MRLALGSRSLLFGVHQVFIHPWMVAKAWTRLYGFPWDVRLWLCFLVHDWGYWGCPDMDGELGKKHPLRGARIVKWLLGREWGLFCIAHSRHAAKMMGVRPSRLCAADKLASAVYPPWLYVRLGLWSGEIWEYLEDHAHPENPYALADDDPLRLRAVEVYDALARFDRPGMIRALEAWYVTLSDWLTDWTDHFIEEAQ